jgi:PhzF family phenazine biosynthesis protein
MKIWTVDAFTDKPFQGNPAGVVILDRFASDEQLQSIASELNLSETAFLKKLSPDTYHLRWFTPAVEVQLCGHATLAAAHILFEENVIQSNQITFGTLSGFLSVLKAENSLIMDFPLQPVTRELDISSLLSIFGSKITQASLALDDIIVELDSEEAVRSFKPDFTKIAQLDCRGLIITSKAYQPYDFISRFFAPNVGVNEDPVTGSAHCKLADYWQHKLNKTEFRAYQASARGGKMDLSIQKDPKTNLPRVKIKGQARTMITGYLNLEKN